MTKIKQKKKSGYMWVPAATNYMAFGGLGIYVKYKGGPNRILIKEQTSRYCHVVCPDRELIFTWDTNRELSFYPAGSGFHEFVSFNMLDDHVCHKLGFEYVMANYVHTSSATKGSADNRTQGRPKHSNLTILSDSGGFQYMTEVADLINPIELVKWYNSNVDAGMALDLPISISDTELVKRAAKVQKKNLQLMLKYKAPHVELLNIIQGVTNEEARLYRSIVERPDINRVALGGVYRRQLVPGIEYISDLTHTGQKYDQYHILGVFSTPHVASMVALSNLGDKPPHITSDSTTHIQSAKNHAYHHHYDLYKTHKRILFGLNGTKPNTYNTLPCQCAVCTVVKYQDIFGFLPGQMIMNLVAIHNANVFKKYVNIIQDAVQSLPYHEFTDLIVKQVSHIKSENALDTRIALDYVYRVTQDGPKAAKKYYANHVNKTNNHITNAFKDANTKVGIFGTGTDPTKTLSKSAEKTRLYKILSDMERQYDSISA
jgi:queuine/archaeosine tRNA-ribosyltransferase